MEVLHHLRGLLEDRTITLAGMPDLSMLAIELCQMVGHISFLIVYICMYMYYVCIYTTRLKSTVHVSVVFRMSPAAGPNQISHPMSTLSLPTSVPTPPTSTEKHR